MAEIAGVPIQKVFVDGPAGRARAQFRQHPPARGTRLGATVSLEDGLVRTYAWIEQQVVARLAAGGDDGVVSEELIRAD